MNRRDAETQRERASVNSCKRFSQKSSCFNLCVSVSLRLVFVITVAISGCSIPNLEKPQCTEARNAVKRFYSLHVGGDMKPSPENLKALEPFLTSDLFKTLSASTETAKDYFTATEEYPRAFRVGECESGNEDAATLQVLLLWRDDTASKQKEIRIETVRTGDKWLINRVSN